jgi:hypothetical protein
VTPGQHSLPQIAADRHRLIRLFRHRQAITSCKDRRDNLRHFFIYRIHPEWNFFHLVDTSLQQQCTKRPFCGAKI